MDCSCFNVCTESGSWVDVQGEEMNTTAFLPASEGAYYLEYLSQIQCLIFYERHGLIVMTTAQKIHNKKNHHLSRYWDVDCCSVFIAEIIGLCMKYQLLTIHCPPQIKPVSWSGQCWIVYVSLSYNTKGGSLPHRGQQLANPIYSCIRAPAVQMCCTTQRKQIHNIKGHLRKEVWENPHIAPWKIYPHL